MYGQTLLDKKKRNSGERAPDIRGFFCQLSATYICRFYILHRKVGFAWVSRFSLDLFIYKAEQTKPIYLKCFLKLTQ